MKNENVKQQSKNSGIKKLILKTLLLLSPAIACGMYTAVDAVVCIIKYGSPYSPILQIFNSLAIPLVIITAIYVVANIIMKKKPKFGFIVGFLILFLFMCFAGILFFGWYSIVGMAFSGSTWIQIVFYLITLSLYIGAAVYLTKDICKEINRIKKTKGENYINEEH